MRAGSAPPLADAPCNSNRAGSRADRDRREAIDWYFLDRLPGRIDLSRFAPVPLDRDPDWLAARLVGTGHRLRWLVRGECDSPLGCLPFEVHTGRLSYRLGERQLASVPVLRYAARGDPLCDDPQALPGIWRPLREAIGSSGAVFLEGVDTNGPLGALLNARSGPVRELFHVLPWGAAHQRRLIRLEAESGLDGYLKRLGAGTRKDLRRTVRRFHDASNGAARVERFSAVEDVERLAAAVARVSRKTYQYHLLGLGFDGSVQRIEQLRALAAGGWLLAYILWVGEQPVAFQIGHRDERVFYGHEIGFDPAHSKLQPGIFLHLNVIEDLLAQRIEVFDFLSGDSLYKQRLSTDARVERHYYLIPRGWPGTVRATALRALNTLSEGVGAALDRAGLKTRLRRSWRRQAVSRASRDRTR